MNITDSLANESSDVSGEREFKLLNMIRTERISRRTRLRVSILLFVLMNSVRNISSVKSVMSSNALNDPNLFVVPKKFIKGNKTTTYVRYVFGEG